MIRWLLLLLAFLSAFLGLFTVVEVPDVISWTAAVLAGEFGYWVAILPAAILFLTFFSSGIRTTLTFWLSLAALVLLVQPCVQAWWIARSLPQRLRTAFGDPVRKPRAAEPFSFPALFGPAPAKVAAQKFEFSPKLFLDFYPAQGRTGLSPAVVVIHGGGWDTGERGQVDTLNFELSRAGYAVADISYRLSTQAQWPAQREDSRAAVHYLKAHAAELGVDRHRIVLLGRSAGGQIAEATAYGVPDPDIRGVVGLYAPADLVFAYQTSREDDPLRSPALLRTLLGGPPAARKAGYENASSYLIAGPREPPTLLVHGKLDTLVSYRQSERLTDKLAGLGVKHALVTLPWATHAVEYHPQGPSGQLTIYAVEWFLGAVMR
jgi:acetyl esterase/lipase